MRPLVLLFAAGVLATWDTLYSPLLNTAYLKLSTDEIVSIRYDQELVNGDAVAAIESPTEGDYSLALANGVLYSIYAHNASQLAIATLNGTTWDKVPYTTTLKNSTQFFQDASVMTSYDRDSENEMIYIYGGKVNDTVTNRLLEFNPSRKTLQAIISNISPTAFFGASTAVLDTQSVTTVLIGGRASSGWVSMFQIALWEYKSWTFKTVQTSGFSVNSRINALALSVYEGNEVARVLVLGGDLGSSMASPYVLSLNVTDNWNWANVTNVGNFDINDCLGAVVINGTLVSVSGSAKRDGDLKLDLFDVGTLETVDSMDLSLASSSSSPLSSSPLVSSSSLVSSSLSTLTSASPVTSSVSPSHASIAAETIHTTGSNTTTIVMAVVIPVVCIALILLLCWYLYKRQSKSGPTSDPDSEDYFKAISNFDNSSISSWTQQRDNYLNSPRTDKHSHHVTPVTPRTRTFAEPDEFEDNQVSPMNHSNRSRHSLASAKTLSHSEEQKIDDFLEGRDVQVLVSTKRRSKLRITNPDMESLHEAATRSIHDSGAPAHESEVPPMVLHDMASLGSGSTDETVFLEKEGFDDFQIDIEDVMKRLDDDDL